MPEVFTFFILIMSIDIKKPSISKKLKINIKIIRVKVFLQITTTPSANNATEIELYLRKNSRGKIIFLQSLFKLDFEYQP